MSLQQLCMQSIVSGITQKNRSNVIATFISEAPLSLQQELITEIIDMIQNEIRETMQETVSILVPFITKDIMETMCFIGREREDYSKRFPSIPKDTLRICINMAEKISMDMEHIRLRMAYENPHMAHEDNYYYNNDYTESDLESDNDY